MRMKISLKVSEAEDRHCRKHQRRAMKQEYREGRHSKQRARCAGQAQHTKDNQTESI